MIGCLFIQLYGDKPRKSLPFMVMFLMFALAFRVNLQATLTLKSLGRQRITILIVK